MPGATLDAQHLITDDAWRQWYGTAQDARAITNELDQGDGSLAVRMKPRDVVRYGHWLGYQLAASGLKKAQLRRFVNALKQIEALGKDEAALEEQKARLTLFQVQLVHGYSREQRLEPLFEVLKHLIARADDWIQTPVDFKRFMALVEAVTAYYEIGPKPSTQDD